LCNRSAERIELDVVREPPASVDLDDRQPLSIGRFELGIAGDVDLAQLEPELLVQAAHLLECALAQMAPLRVVDDDLDQESTVPAT
jgi:hypothetical protein